MTRIIAGFAGSLTLKVPSAGTRPTSDRVREALFSSLEARDAISGARVLDLYAGSGALGLEAASRGAATVTLVEKSPAAAQVCKANAALVVARLSTSGPLAGVVPAVDTGADPVTLPVTVISKPVNRFLTSTVEQWNLVFIDPPYELDELELGHVLVALIPHLAPDAVIALERSSRTTVPAWPVGLTLDKVSRYGETVIYWLSPREAQ